MLSINMRSTKLYAQCVDWVCKPRILSRLVAAVVPVLALVSAIAHFGFNIDLVSNLSPVTLWPVKLLAEVSCPGCGMMRAIIRLGQLKFSEAWIYHPFSYPVILGTSFFALVGKLPWQRLHGPIALVALGLIIMLWLSRSSLVG